MSTEVAVSTLFLTRQILVTTMTTRPWYRLRSRLCELKDIVSHIEEDLLRADVNHICLFLDLPKHGDSWRLLKIFDCLHILHLESAC